MVDGAPVLLIASVSPRDCRVLERALEKTGGIPLRVGDAGIAARHLDGESRAILVIDAGLLEMPHDPQWRRLWSRHPELRVVVRCLLPRTQRLPTRSSTPYEVHPDDLDGLCDAIRRLAASPARARRRPDPAPGLPPAEQIE